MHQLLIGGVTLFALDTSYFFNRCAKHDMIWAYFGIFSLKFTVSIICITSDIVTWSRWQLGFRVIYNLADFDSQSIWQVCFALRGTFLTEITVYLRFLSEHLRWFVYVSQPSNWTHAFSLLRKLNPKTNLIKTKWTHILGVKL